MEYTNTQWLLDKRPDGMPEDSCWKMHKELITSLKKMKFLLKLSTYQLILI